VSEIRVGKGGSSIKFLTRDYEIHSNHPPTELSGQLQSEIGIRIIAAMAPRHARAIASVRSVTITSLMFIARSPNHVRDAGD